VAQERSRPVGSSRLYPEDLTRRSFATVRRGYDPAEVRQALEQASKAIAGLAERNDALARQLEEARQHAAKPVIDERTLTEALGEETARVLRSAHEAASDIVKRAEEQAQRLLADARDELARAEGRVAAQHAEMEQAAAQIHAAAVRGAEEEAAQIRRRAENDAAAGLAAAHAEGEALIRDAREERARILSDLLERRRVAHAQVQQLEAGRAALIENLEQVRRAAEQVSENVQRAGAVARREAELARSRSQATLEPLSFEGEQVPPTREPDAGLQRRTRREERESVSASREHVEELFARIKASAAIGEGETRGSSGDPGQAGATALVDHGAEAGDGGTTDAGTTDAGTTAELRRVRADDQLAPAGADGPGAEAVGEGDPRAGAGQAGGGRALPGQGVGDAALPGEEAESRTEVRKAAPGKPATAPVPGEPAAAPAQAATVPGQMVTAPGKPAAAPGKPAAAPARAATVPGEPATVPGKPAAAPARAATVPGQMAPHGGFGAEAILARRDTLLDPVSTDLSRRLKRALQDDQNQLLDALRKDQKAGQGALGDLPMDLFEHEDRYRSAAAAQLAQAARLGAYFAQEVLDGAARTLDDTGARSVAEPLGNELARAIVDPLRHDVLEVLKVEEPDEQERVGALGSVFRQWRSDRAARLAGDFVTSAFAAGMLAAAEDDVAFVWIVDDVGAPCPDCADNSLAGPVLRGHAYPTGHMHPSMHTGCRCLIVPARA